MDLIEKAAYRETLIVPSAAVRVRKIRERPTFHPASTRSSRKARGTANRMKRHKKSEKAREGKGREMLCYGLMEQHRTRTPTLM